MFPPYRLVLEVPRIERELFNHNKLSSIFFIASLRDRFMLLQTTFGVLRGESLIKCELSDLCDNTLTGQGTHDCQIVVMQISIGKTNGL